MPYSNYRIDSYSNKLKITKKCLNESFKDDAMIFTLRNRYVMLSKGASHFIPDVNREKIVFKAEK